MRVQPVQERRVYRLARSWRWTYAVMVFLAALVFPKAAVVVAGQSLCMGGLFFVWPFILVYVLWLMSRMSLVVYLTGIEFHLAGSTISADWDDVECIYTNIFGQVQLQLKRFKVRSNWLTGWWLRVTGADCKIPLSGSGELWMWEKDLLADIFSRAPHLKK
jgi:hypothetical protein